MRRPGPPPGDLARMGETVEAGPLPTVGAFPGAPIKPGSHRRGLARKGWTLA